MPPEAGTLRRHDWAWLKPEALTVCRELEAEDRTFLQKWVDSGRPLVVARRNAPHALRLGVTRPEPGPRRRVGVTVAPDCILRSMPPLALADVVRHAPPAWHPTLRALQRLARCHAVDIRVYGSLALQYFSPQPCLNADSDLDLLLEPRPAGALEPFLAALARLQARHPLPRMDGEVRRGDWAVPWRELATALHAGGWVLAKSDQGLTLQREPGLPGRVARAAVRALHQELMLAPKPGLVSPRDNGAHVDMQPALFLKSLFSLRHYFARVAEAGAQGASFAPLQALGRQAEVRMMQATDGVNTHRGAIFHLGLMAAAAGACPGADAPTLCRHIAQRWGRDILASAGEHVPHASHGRWVTQRYGLGGARCQAAAGFPVLLEQGLPLYRRVLGATGAADRAALAAFLAMMAVLDDSNLVWRGGLAGLRFAQSGAARLLADEAWRHPDWPARVEALHRQFVARHLSPGGSADLLALLLLLREIACD